MSRHGMVDASNNNEPAHKEEVNAHYSATSSDGLQLGTASNNAPDHGADVDHEESGDRFWKSIKAWSEVTTYHGIRMVFDESTSIFRRGFWLVTTITFLIVALWFCQDQLNRYMSYKTLIEEVSMHPDTMPFPAITICSYNLVRNDSINDIRERQLLIQLFQSQKPNLTDIAEEFGTTFLNNISLRRLFENGSMTAEEYFHECYWERTISNCSEWMKTMTTSGFCYTFNAKYQTESGSAAILKVARVTGKRYGLHLILLVNPSNYFISDDDSVGYKVVIHDPWEYPDENQALSVAPGFAHYIAVTKHEHVYMPYPVLAFGDQVCVDINDVSLSLTHKNYTVQHCKHECRVQFIYDQCHCVGPLDDVHYPDCSPDALVSCYTDADRSFSSYAPNCYCPVPCEVTEYRTTLSSAALPSHRKLAGGPEGVARDGLLDVFIYYEDMVVKKHEQVLAVTFDAMWGAFGGFLGLCVGTSIVTFTEILELFLMNGIHHCRSMVNMFRDTRPTDTATFSSV